jgi:hypothetical protein
VGSDALFYLCIYIFTFNVLGKSSGIGSEKGKLWVLPDASVLDDDFPVFCVAKISVLSSNTFLSPWISA